MTSILSRILQISPKSVLTRMLTGALIGLAVVSFFVFGADNPDPAWGPLWRLRPLIVTPTISAFGFLSFYLSYLVQPKSTIAKALLLLASGMAFIISLWIGIVLGLAGTMWN